VRAVPEISRFLGIVVSMYYDEHAPPHFHARRGEYKLIVEIETLATTGRFPVEAANAVRAWARAHQRELRENWRLMRNHETPHFIAPWEQS
jgi:hypothetical protein